MTKYKLETWEKTLWKGQTREQVTLRTRLVRRDAKGHFTGKNPVITKIQEKNYAKGHYRVGVIQNKIVVRQYVSPKDKTWYEQREERIKTKEKNILRSSYVLNNVPISKKGYFGFRIVAFHTNRNLLDHIKPKLKARLIKWIENCINYDHNEFWFDMYFGYEPPTNANTYASDNGKYFLTYENKNGIVLKENDGKLSDL